VTKKLTGRALARFEAAATSGRKSWTACGKIKAGRGKRFRLAWLAIVRARLKSGLTQRNSPLCWGCQTHPRTMEQWGRAFRAERRRR